VSGYGQEEANTAIVVPGRVDVCVQSRFISRSLCCEVFDGEYPVKVVVIAFNAFI